jgi:hypothetical protein
MGKPQVVWECEVPAASDKYDSCLDSQCSVLPRRTVELGEMLWVNQRGVD